MAKEELIIGIDLGGTKILAGIFDSSYQCLGSGKKKTQANLPAEKVIERIVECVHEALEESTRSLDEVRVVGIGSPGSVNPDTGIVHFAGNLGWRDVPLRDALSKHLVKPVIVGNDCNVATLGIHHVEYLGEPENMACLFLGTGIGGGLILNRRLFTGPTHTAFEVGHMVLKIDGPNTTSGIRGTWEALASRTAITRQIVKAVEDGAKTELTDITKKGLSKIKSRNLAKAVALKDKLVTEIISKSAYATGVAIGNLMNILNLQHFVLGGGVIEALEGFMLPIIQETAEKHTFPGAFEDVKICATKLADEAGIIGAAVLAHRNL